jgi:hypothetical protein
VWSNTNMVRVRLDIFARLEAAGLMRGFDWIVELDGDELQGYPKGVASMPAFFDELERAGFNTVHGVWRDRVTADGSLQATDPRLSLFDQFPVTCSLRVVGKIMARHYDIPVTDGKHTVTPAGHRVARIWDRATHGAPGDASLPVWHFKWVDGIVERLHAKVKMARGQTGRVDKSSTAILAYLTQHNNSFDLATLFRRRVCCDAATAKRAGASPTCNDGAELEIIDPVWGHHDAVLRVPNKTATGGRRLRSARLRERAA